MARQLSLHGIPKELVIASSLLLLLFIFLLTVVPIQIIIPPDRLTTGFRVAYNIVVAVLATILTQFAASEIQKQWLRCINHQISGVKYQLDLDPSIAARWRTVLGISNMSEDFKHIKTTGLARLSTIATALITAATVAGVTLTDTTCASTSRAPRIHSGRDNACTRSIPSYDTERLSPLFEFRTFWNRDNGSAYIATTMLGCPSWSGAQNLGEINTVNPDQYAYARNGVAVKNTAIGTPEILYTNLMGPPEKKSDNMLINESSLRSLSHCLPVMTRNPIKCRVGGDVAFQSQPGNNTITVDAGGCHSEQKFNDDPNAPFGVMVSNICTVNNSVGKATIAFGATGIISLSLAASMGDKAFLAANAGKYDGIRNKTITGLKYAASCSIDVEPTIAWRKVTLKLKQGTLDPAPSYSKQVVGEGLCPRPRNASAPWKLGEGYQAGAVGALEPLLNEGRFWNGMSNSILNVALKTNDTSDRYSTVDAWTRLVRSKPFGFNESENALEDVLGLVTGITMSQMSTLDSMSPGSPMSDPVQFYPPVIGNATFACTRVGSGLSTAFVFTIPALLAFVLCVYLLCTVERASTQWKTSRLGDLIAIGMASERELNMAYRADKRKTVGHALSALHLGPRNKGIASDADEEILMTDAATPAGWGQRWVTDAGGTRAIPVKGPEVREKEAGGGWTTGLPKSPVRLRHEDGHAAMDGVK
jgi:hypothetical protein